MHRPDFATFRQGEERVSQASGWSDKAVAQPDHVHQGNWQEHERSQQSRSIAMKKLASSDKETAPRAYETFQAQQHKRNGKQTEQPIQNGSRDKRALDLAINEKNYSATAIYRAFPLAGCGDITPTIGCSHTSYGFPGSGCSDFFT